MAIVAAVGIQERYPHTPVKERVAFDYNEGFPSFSPETIRAASFGYAFPFASLLWIRFLLQTPPKDLGANEVSWVYLDLDAISVIDPDFMPVYTHGAIYLSVVTEDKKGAQLLLEKGVARYPDFWKIRAYLAYHYQYELNDMRKAAEQYEAAAKLPGAPAFFAPLAATLYTKAGDTLLARRFLESMIRESADPGVRRRLEDKLRKLEREEP